MIAPVAAQRVLRGVAANIDVTFVDQNGEPAAAGGTVTVDVTKDDGTVVATGASTSAISGVTGGYRYALAAMSTLELLTFVWKDGGVARLTTQADIAGAVYCSAADMRAFDTSVDFSFDDATIHRVRREVEDECELITHRAWVPRYRRKRYDVPDGTALILDDQNPRTIRSIRLYTDTTHYTAFSSTELAGIAFDETGVLTRQQSRAWWWAEAGVSLALLTGLVVEYEYGYDAPPSDLKHAAMTRLRSRLMMEQTGIPDRATSFTIGGGGVFSLATPGRAGFETGIPDVDAVYQRYAAYMPGVA